MLCGTLLNKRNELLSSTAETASTSNARWHRGICLCRRAGDRNAVIHAEHCLRVTIDLTCGRRWVQGWRCDGYRIHGTIRLSEKSSSERCTTQKHERR